LIESMPRGQRGSHIRSSQEKSSTVSKNVAMFIDVANIYYAARGQDVDVDYVALLKHATKGRDLIRAYAYSGLDPENENQRKFIDFLSKNGYKVVTKDIRKFGDGRVKANLDIELVVDLFRLSDRMDIAVIVSGDGDFAPAIRALQDTGVRCEVISFKPNTSSDLIAVADEFQDIQKIAGIGRKKGEGSRADAMATPEMPAKEVVPEFGFRDASPSIAAAALAAIRGGPSTRGGTTRGTRPRGRAAVPATEATDEAAVAVSPAAAATNGDTDEAGRRRRRRRGGRGRSRGRREETVQVAVPAADAEIGWEEFDDLSQLEGLGEEREYTFSEADPETLRELGLLDGDASAAAVAEPVVEPQAPVADEAKPRARRRSSRAKVTEPAEAEAPAQEGEEPKPRTRRRSTRAAATTTDAEAPPAEQPKPRRRRKAATTAEADPGEAVEAKPARRRSTRSRSTSEGSEAPAADASAPEEESAPQGIWGRFRSGRSQGS
jgi:uncharacterized LabA/DUF88 family protein